MLRATILAAATILFAGCAQGQRMELYRQADLVAPAAIEGSIFPSDLKLVGNDDVAKVLDGRVVLREGGNLAVLPIGRMPFTDAGYGDTLNERIRTALAGNRFVGEVVTVPRMLMPQQLNVATIREMGARLQCENVLVYTAWNDSRYEWNMFTKDELRVDLTVEAVIINVRTGCIPLARSIDVTTVVTEAKQDHDTYTFVRRGQRTCLADALTQVCQRLNQVMAVAAAPPTEELRPRPAP